MDERANRVGNSPDWKAQRKLMYSHKNELLENSRRCQIRKRGLEFRLSQLKDEYEGINNTRPLLDAFEQGNNPLKNEYMVEMIANYLPAQDLRNCRLVCRFFAQEFGRCLDKRSILIMTEDSCQDVLKMLGDQLQRNTGGLSTICAFDIPTTGYMFTKLLKRYGSTLGGLKLEECNVTTESLGDILTRKAPYLESLSVIEKDLTEADATCPFFEISQRLKPKKPLVLPFIKRLQWEDCRVPLEQMVETFPNLVELNCGGLPIPNAKKLGGLKWKSLKYLKIFPKKNVSIEYLEALIMLKVPLCKLVLFGVKPQGHKWMLKLKKFLESVGNTLEELQLYQDYFGDESTNYTHLPVTVKLPQLQTFILDRSLMNSFRWMNDMPKLESLECKMVNLSQVDALIEKGKPKVHKMLSKLTIGCIDHHSVHRVSKFFPNITNLDIESGFADDDCLRAIIKDFKNLEVLKISKSYHLNYPMPLTDSGLTGFLKKDCEKILKEKKYWEVDAKALRKYPYIGDLKKLIKIKIHSPACTLTDLSVFFGIADLKLLMLTMPSCQITNATLECVQERMTSLTLLEISETSSIPKADVEKVNKSRHNMHVRTYAAF